MNAVTTESSEVPDEDRSANQMAGMPDIAAALRLFDETTRALEARSCRLEEVLTVKQRALEKSNTLLEEKVQELDNLSAYLNLVMASVSSGVIAVNCDLLITTCNPAAEYLLQHLSSELIEIEYAQLFPSRRMQTVITEGIEVGPYEHSMTTASGEQCILSAKASPIRDGSGNIIGAVEIFEDVTAIRQLQERAERGERLKALGEMAAGVAHEIRNPLNGISGFASLLKRDIDQDDPRYRYVHSIDEGVRHLNNTVTSLLEFTSPKEPQRRDIPPVELLQDCIDLVRSAYTDESAEVSITLTNNWGNARIACDPTQIRQVILNVLNNAVQAAVNDHDSARVDICMNPTVAAGLELIIEDDGPGIPEAQRKNIFTPFFTTKDEGTGLGLAISHSIINLHGGSMSVGHSPQLSGARFQIHIPND